LNESNQETNKSNQQESNDDKKLHSPRTRTIFINNFADSMSKKEQEDLEFALTQALFATVKEICKIFCCFSDKLNKLVEERWEYTYHSIRMVVYMLDLRFLETNNLSEEAMGYFEFTTFTKKKFGQDKYVSLFIELVKFQKKTSPYNNEVIWNSATSFTLLLWWQLWPYKTNCDNSDSDELFDNGFEMNVIDLVANE
ncbi:35731_t:CDS:2, partial [Gigaspora margarita]